MSKVVDIIASMKPHMASISGGRWPFFGDRSLHEERIYWAMVATSSLRYEHLYDDFKMAYDYIRLIESTYKVSPVIAKKLMANLLEKFIDTNPHKAALCAFESYCTELID